MGTMRTKKNVFFWFSSDTMVCYHVDAVVVYWYDIDKCLEKHILEVKCWYQCRSCRDSSLAVVCPYCYKQFACDGRGLSELHVRDCPRTYPFRFRHLGPESKREMWRRRYGLDLMRATTRDLSERQPTLLLF